MGKQVGLWINHAGARIVALDAEPVSVKTIESNVEGHRKSAGHAGAPRPAHVGGGTESRDERRHGEHLRRYYDEVAALVRGADQLLIMGPGEAPAEFQTRLHRLGWDPCATVLRRCDKMTDVELTAAVKSYFGRPGPPRM